MKKLVSTLLASAMALGLCLPALAQDASPIVILSTNDVHGATEGFAAAAAIQKDLEKQYGEEFVTLVDAGDAIQGSPITTLSGGSTAVDIMNYMGYDYAIPGNHEFDYGLDAFLSLAKDAEYPYLSCNFKGADGKTVFAPYAMEDYGAVQVAFVGISTPETLTKSDPTHFQDKDGKYIYSFCEDTDGTALYDAVQTSVDAARKEGADYVVAIAHLGMEGTTPMWTSSAVIANTTGIDVMIDGHSHEAYQKEVANEKGETVALLQTGTKLANLGCVTIAADGKITTELKPLDAEGIAQDSETASFIEKLTAEFDEKLNEVISTISYPLMATKPDSTEWAVRSQETNLGDLTADAYRWAMGADVGLANGGGIRANIPAGDVTYNSLISVQPYGNELCLVEATGQNILDALEIGAMKYPESSGGFMQVSGLTYTINEAIPSSVVTDDKGNFVKVDGDYRVTDVKVDGEPLVLDKIYTVASHNYLIKSGGDGINVFQSGKLLKDSVLLDNQSLINYFTEQVGSMGTYYENPKGVGRITIVNEPVVDPNPDPDPEPTPDPDPEPVPESRTYTVKAGDSLWAIAARELGSGYRWQEIYDLNSDTVKNPARIYVGQVLKLPQK